MDSVMTIGLQLELLVKKKSFISRFLSYTLAYS